MDFKILYYQLLFCYIFLFSINLHGQSSEDIAATHLFIRVLEKENNELEDTTAKSDKSSLLFPLFSTYKFLFSKNDVPRMCRFHPTCGNYGALALKKYGSILGGLKTADRLLRCNNLHYSNQYTYLPSKNKYLDYP